MIFPILSPIVFLLKLIIDEFSTQFKTSSEQFQMIQISDDYKHILTHQRIFARFYHLKIRNEDSFLKIKSLNSNQFISIKQETIEQYPLPRLVDKYLTENLNI